MNTTPSSDPGYLLHEDEVRQFADLAASMLGQRLDSLNGEERIRACHALLEQHPYAYPFALELSLRLPPAMAITWLRKLRETFYAQEDVQNEIDPFQIWRMPPIQALTTALRHSERAGFFLPGVMAYLQEHRPALARCFQMKRGNNKPDGTFQTCCGRLLQGIGRLFYRACAAPGQMLPEPLLRFYMRHDTKDRSGNPPQRMATWFLAYILANRQVETQRERLRRGAVALPAEEEPSTGGQQASEKSIDVVTVIWGKTYVERWAEINAPTLLAPGNIPAMAKKMSVCLVFYTTHEDRDRIRSLPVYRRLKQFAAIRFVIMDSMLRDTAHDLLGLRFADKYAPMTAAHNHCMRHAAQKGRYVFFNFPDIIWQKDFFEKISARIKSGKTHIFYYSGPYTELEAVQKNIKKFLDDDVLAISNEGLREICSKYRHTSSLLNYDNSPLRYFGAIMRMYRIKTHGDIIHMACFVPIILKPDPNIYTRTTIDADHPISPLLPPQQMEIITDNVSLCVASMDPRAAQDNAMRWPPYDLASFARDFRLGMNLWNRIFFSLPCRFYSGAISSEEEWGKAHQTASREVKEILHFGSKALPVPPAEIFTAGARNFLQNTMQEYM
ncbi:MAG: hypothetical protein F8N36_09105 [Desulfovibrio sp.]|uniref:hypothetical protein n=1 Tax=Desulfovibrio sp. TaxID=885 RepID=UPI00135DDD9B|nr:hypothetical protein [Desulfovibrio sp.]MTJ93005.1 hypothetical protein [Desulfovibrio sp.]